MIISPTFFFARWVEMSGDDDGRCLAYEQHNTLKIGDVVLNLRESIGRGGNGEVSMYCHDNKCDYVAKNVTINDDGDRRAFVTESHISKYAGDHGFAPKVYDWFHCAQRGVGVLVMDRLSCTMTERAYMLKKCGEPNATPDIIAKCASLRDARGLSEAQMLGTLLTAVNAMHLSGIFHMDLYTKNVMLTHLRYAKIIDFGMAVATSHELDPRLRALDYATLLFGMPDEDGWAMGDLEVLGMAILKGAHKLPEDALPAVVISYLPWAVRTRCHASFDEKADAPPSSYALPPNTRHSVMYDVLVKSPGFWHFANKAGADAMLTYFAYANFQHDTDESRAESMQTLKAVRTLINAGFGK